MMKIGVVLPSWSTERSEKTANNLIKYDTQNLVVSYQITGSNRTEARWGPVEAMAKGAVALEGSGCDVLVFCHDDIEVYEDWAIPVSTIFEVREDAGLVGFHGAKGLGSEDIYRTKYQLNQLARYNPMSNMLDAEKHGKKVTLPCEVATVDGFFMAVRTKTYYEVGGWEACLKDNIPYHMYDSWMAMVAREHGYSTFLAPVNCRHSGGATEVGMAAEYEIWAKENGFKDSSEVHVKGHEAFYGRFRGQLPIRIR
jgi:hypothetical protein